MNYKGQHGDREVRGEEGGEKQPGRSKKSRSKKSGSSNPRSAGDGSKAAKGRRRSESSSTKGAGSAGKAGPAKAASKTSKTARDGKTFEKRTALRGKKKKVGRKAAAPRKAAAREADSAPLVRPDTSIEGRRRVVIEKIWPCIDGGVHPIKRVCGERVTVEAAVYADGHELLAGRLRHRRRGEETWNEVPLELMANDRWSASFQALEVGWYEYTLCAWVDRFSTWRQDLKKRADAGQDLDVELRIGAPFVREAADGAEPLSPEDARLLHQTADLLEGAGASEDEKGVQKRLAKALDPALPSLMSRYAPRRFATEHGRILEVFVDRERARYSTWYELFPRSTSPEPGRHGTFRDVEARLPHIAEMGFDVLYLPPIHPIGRRFRKGKNNSVTAEPGDPGSPWAIGGPEGGHKSIHPKLGSLDDFRGLVAATRGHGMEIALDIAFQCSPDHPYVRDHPDWFLKRPDGTIQYAENPPKKYQDIYPFNFDCDDWRSLWTELCGIFLYWIEQGVKIFRVDNPHTKPFKFWSWCIDEIRRRHPEVILLSEAFTRPHPMYKLAKVGFDQSYTYFAWKNTKHDLTQWWTETVLEEPREYYRPNLWPNTPDILNAYLQHGGRPAFMSRLILAATMGASYGVYGPAFELIEHTPREPGSEEYMDSEKYEIRHWDLERHGSIRHLITLINRIRRQHPSLQTNESFAFHDTDNDQLISYSKRDRDRNDVILTVVNLDPYHIQSGWIDLNLDELGMPHDAPFQAHDLVTGARYLWHGPRAFVSLDPHAVPAHILLLRRHVRTERDFDYFV